MVSIIDADGHVDEPRAVWQEYTEPAYRDQVIQLVRDRDGLDKLKIEGKLRGDATLNIAAACIPKALTDAERSKALTWDDVPAGGYDPHARLTVMDQEGIETVFLYPSLWPMFGDIRDPQVAAAACRAYNNWMADFCRVQPDRLHGTAPVPPDAFERESLVAEHGFAALVTVSSGNTSESLLFDAGLSKKGLIHNMDVLDVKPKELHTIVLSHGHADHTRGLMGMVERLDERKMPLLLHPDAFLQRKVIFPDGHEINLPPPDRRILSQVGLNTAQAKELVETYKRR